MAESVCYVLAGTECAMCTKVVSVGTSVSVMHEFEEALAAKLDRGREGIVNGAHRICKRYLKNKLRL
jgi:hypothetical protein